jgi:hypothetical protein
MVVSLVDGVSNYRGSAFQNVRYAEKELVAHDPSGGDLPPGWACIPAVSPSGLGEAI